MKRAKEAGNADLVEIERLVNFGDRADIQVAILAWAGAMCDRESLKTLKSIYQAGALSMRLSALAQTRDYLRRVEQCVSLSALRSNAETWIKKSLEGP